MKVNFISGLPRSGTSLLASLLRQNPRVYASLESPMGRIVTDAVTAMGVQNEAHLFITDDQKRAMLRGLFEDYYASYDYVFDNNRRWMANLPLLHELFPKAQVICCVRDPVEIVDSFEYVFRKHPLALSLITGATANKTVYARTDDLMGEGAVLGFAWRALKDAFFGPFAQKLWLVEYRALAESPLTVLREIEQVCGLPSHQYDFDHIQSLPYAAEFDEQLGTPGLHELGTVVRYTEHPSSLPPDLAAALPKPFWRVKQIETKDR